MAKAGSREQLSEVVDRLQAEVAELRVSRRRVAEAAYADRQAIERALHDGVQQYLVALAIDLRHLSGLLESDPAAATALVDEMAVRAREALEETSVFAHAIYPPLLEGRGFAVALRYAADGADVTAVVDISSGDYPAEIMAAIYWCWLEVLSSAPRGSAATVGVRDEHGGLTFEFIVAGHNPEARHDRFRDRIEALDGRLGIDERSDGGLRLHGWLPRSR
jgi:signal transduction histidine kinase